ncbi:MAG: hypothetical protein AAGD96_34110 [Chloroflexota bacterium]
MSPKSLSPEAERQDLLELKEFEYPNTLIGRFRAWIHGLAGKWAVRYLTQQQNEINIFQNEKMNHLIQAIKKVDEDGVETRKQLAEMTTVVAQLKKQLDEAQKK